MSAKGAHAARDRIGPGLFTMDPDPAEKKFFENVFRVRDFSDVTLASEGETKNEAHKMVLISASHKQIQQKIEQLLLKIKHTTERSKLHKTFILTIESLITKQLISLYSFPSQ